MDIGIPKEIKAQEGRVSMMPEEVSGLVARGHRVRVERDAGSLSGASDADYASAGAEIVDQAEAVFAASEMIVKVKEILPPEYEWLRRDHILFTNIHSALNRELTDIMLDVGLTGIAAEETHENGSPNCPLAGEVGAFEGVRLCLAPHGGSGRHFMGHFGAPPLKALVIGLGQVGCGALRTLLRLGASVTGFDISARARAAADLAWNGSEFRAVDVSALEEHLSGADLVVNCVLWPKHRTDHLITRDMLKALNPSAVIVDISCDTAGAVETCRPTTWADPVYDIDGIRHFCVDNIPGAVPVTASTGYSKAIQPFVALIAEIGAVEACREKPWLARGLTCVDGTLILEETGRLQDRPFTPVDLFLAAN